MLHSGILRVIYEPRILLYRSLAPKNWIYSKMIYAIRFQCIVIECILILGIKNVFPGNSLEFPIVLYL